MAVASGEGAQVLPVAEQMLPPTFSYQGYSRPWIEDFFLEFWLRDRPATGLHYLPVLWANFYQHVQVHEYTPRQSLRIMESMRHLLAHELDRTKRYFTLMAYDHAIWEWHAFPHNVLVFSAGGWGDVPIPWLKGSPRFTCPRKDIFLSFVGRLGGASDFTGLRSRMFDALKGDALFAQGTGWRETMGRSTFSLCPRGLGRSSYRLYESLSLGSIPVYIWDDVEWLPYSDEIDWDEISIRIHVDDLGGLGSLLRSYSPGKILSMQSRIAELHESYFTLEGACRQICRMSASLRDGQRFGGLVSKRS